MPHSASQRLFYRRHLHLSLLAQSLNIYVEEIWKEQHALGGGTNKTHQKSLIESTVSNALSLARPSQVQPGHGVGHYIQQFLVCGVDGRSQRMGFLIQQITPASNKD